MLRAEVGTNVCKTSSWVRGYKFCLQPHTCPEYLQGTELKQVSVTGSWMFLVPENSDISELEFVAAPRVQAIVRHVLIRQGDRYA